MTVDQFLGRLEGTRRTGTGWIARCPAHDDHVPSLSVGEGRDGAVLVKCHAGCSTDAILEALGLSARDLFSAEAEQDQVRPSPNLGREPEATYPYRDAHGALLAEKIRYPGKRFAWRRPDGRGGWIYNRSSIRVPLYRLDEVQRGQHSRIFLVEGEKDADRIWQSGWPATTSPDGAGRWSSRYADDLVAAGVSSVAVLPDNDGPGEQHALEAARSCHAAGIEVRLVKLPDLPAGGDVSDYLAVHTKQDLAALVRQTTLWHPAEAAAEQAPAGLALVRLSELLDRPPAPVNWLWENRIPVGALSVCIGKPKAGKSTLLRCLCLAVARGEAFLGWPTQQGVAWYIALEERELDVVDHFARLGATRDDPVSCFIGQAPADMLAQLRTRAATERPALIVIDPLQRFLRLRDISDYAEQSNKFDPVIALAREVGAAIVFSHHAPKGERDDVDAALGSIGIVGSVHTQLRVKRTEKYRTLSSLQRTGPDLDDPLVIELDSHSGWVTAEATRSEVDEKEAEDGILALLQGCGGPMSEKDIRAEAGTRTHLVNHALRALVVRGAITRSGTGRRGQPFQYMFADSRFVVPTLGREQENEQPEQALSCREIEGNARSRVSGGEASWEHDSDSGSAGDEEVIPL